MVRPEREGDEEGAGAENLEAPQGEDGGEADEQDAGHSTRHNVASLSKALIETCGSLERAFAYFDYGKRKKISRLLFDTGCSGLRLDIQALCGVPITQLWKLLEKADPAGKGDITLEVWTNFFGGHLEGTADESLLGVDYGDRRGQNFEAMKEKERERIAARKQIRMAITSKEESLPMARAMSEPPEGRGRATMFAAMLSPESRPGSQDANWPGQHRSRSRGPRPFEGNFPPPSTEEQFQVQRSVSLSAAAAADLSPHASLGMAAASGASGLFGGGTGGAGGTGTDGAALGSSFGGSSAAGLLFGTTRGSLLRTARSNFGNLSGSRPLGEGLPDASDAAASGFSRRGASPTAGLDALDGGAEASASAASGKPAAGGLAGGRGGRARATVAVFGFADALPESAETSQQGFPDRSLSRNSVASRATLPLRSRLPSDNISQADSLGEISPRKLPAATVREEDETEEHGHSDIANSTNLYVKGLPEDWDEEKISAEFGKFGTITSMAVRSDDKGRTFAFVSYEDAQMAKKCAEEMHMKEVRSEEEIAKAKEDHKEHEVGLDGRPAGKLYVERVHSKTERAAELLDRFSSNKEFQGSSSAPTRTRRPSIVSLRFGSANEEAEDQSSAEDSSEESSGVSSEEMAGGASASDRAVRKQRSLRKPPVPSLAHALLQKSNVAHAPTHKATDEHHKLGRQGSADLPTEEGVERLKTELDQEGIDALAQALMGRFCSLRKAYKWFDTINNGLVSHVAWHTGLGLLHMDVEKVTKVSAEVIWGHLDPSLDGNIHYKEWKRFFALVDPEKLELWKPARKKKEDPVAKPERATGSGQGRRKRSGGNVAQGVHSSRRQTHKEGPEKEEPTMEEPKYVSEGGSSLGGGRKRKTWHPGHESRGVGDGASSGSPVGAGRRRRSISDPTPRSIQEANANRPATVGDEPGGDIEADNPLMHKGGLGVRSAMRIAAASQKQQKQRQLELDLAAQERNEFLKSVKEKLSALTPGTFHRFSAMRDWEREIINQVASSMKFYCRKGDDGGIVVANLVDFTAQTRKRLQDMEEDSFADFGADSFSEMQRHLVREIASELKLDCRTEGEGDATRVVVFRTGDFAYRTRKQLEALEPGDGRVFSDRLTANQRRIVLRLASELSLFAHEHKGTGGTSLEVINLTDFANQMRSKLEKVAAGEHVDFTGLSDQEKRVLQCLCEELDLACHHISSKAGSTMQVANLRDWREQVKAELEKLEQGEAKDFPNDLLPVQVAEVHKIAEEMRFHHAMAGQRKKPHIRVRRRREGVDGQEQAEDFAIDAEGFFESEEEEEEEEKSEEDMIEKIFDAYASGLHRSDRIFLRFPDLNAFAEEVADAMPQKHKVFLRFSGTLEQIFDDTLQLQWDLGVRTRKGLNRKWFQVFIQKAMRAIGIQIVSLLYAVLNEHVIG